MAVHGTRHRETVSWDYSGLLQLLGNLARERTGLPLLRCYWYEATVEGRRSPEHEALADLPGLKLRLGRIRPGRREGVDTEIHRDLMTLARNRSLADAIVVSNDEDLAQIITDAQDLGVRVTVVHVAVDGNWTISRALRQECDDLIEIGSGHLRPYVNLLTGVDTSSAPLSNGHAATSGGDHLAGIGPGRQSRPQPGAERGFRRGAGPTEPCEPGNEPGRQPRGPAPVQPCGPAAGGAAAADPQPAVHRPDAARRAAHIAAPLVSAPPHIRLAIRIAASATAWPVHRAAAAIAGRCPAADVDTVGRGEGGSSGRPGLRRIRRQGRARAVARGGARPQAANAVRPGGPAVAGLLAAHRFSVARRGTARAAARILGRSRTLSSVNKTQLRSIFRDQSQWSAWPGV
jgi:hypothetical protein